MPRPPKNYKGKRRSSRPMRLPNGFGSIVYLGAGRRRPYAAKTPTKGYTLDGHPIRETIGYYETWDDAYTALVEYKKSPYDIDVRKATFADVYQMLCQKKYENEAKQLSESNRYVFSAAYKKSAPLHDRIFNEIKAPEMQQLLDDIGHRYKHASVEHAKSLWNQMYKLAMEYDIVSKNYASFVEIRKADDDEHGVPFTRAEVDRMWEVVDTVPGIDAVLVMIYSGFRISEYIDLQVDLDRLTFYGGLKTDAGRERTVPIHNRIIPLVRRLLADKRLFGVKSDVNRKRFKDAIQLAGIDLADHTPHDCRHTLATFLDKAEAPIICTKLILGHSIGQDVTNKVYIHKSIEDLREIINLVP